MFGLLIFLAYQQPGGFASAFITVNPAYSIFIIPIAVAFFVFGILALILTWGIWKGKGWAWLMSLILATDAIIVGAFGALIGALAFALPILLYGIILIFLGLYSVRAYCGRTYVSPYIFPPVPVNWGAPPPIVAPPPMPAVAPPPPPVYAPPPMAPVQQPYYPPHPPPPAQRIANWNTGPVSSCPNCGAQLPYDAMFCASCGTRFR